MSEIGLVDTWLRGAATKPVADEASNGRNSVV